MSTISIDSTGIYVDGERKLIMPNNTVDLENLYQSSTDLDGGSADTVYSVADIVIDCGGAL